MWIERLKLENFRIYSNYETVFSKGVNIIVGPNGTGKTTILEAIKYASSFRPLRRLTKDQDLVKAGYSSFYIEATVQYDSGNTYTLTINYDMKTTRKKKITLNGKKMDRQRDVVGIIKAVDFTLGDYYLVMGAPAERRRFLDITIANMNREYIDALSLYNYYLLQRNKLLKQIAKTQQEKGEINSSDLELLNSYTVKLVEYGVKIIETREKFLKTLEPFVSRIYEEMYGDKVKLFYKSSLNLKGVPPENLKNEYLKQLEENKQKDIVLKTTTLGPHRDDILIVLERNGVRLMANKVASQGQVRTLATSLKLGAAIQMEHLAGEKPILLVDDILIEMDQERKDKFIKLLEERGYQMIITLTDLNQVRALLDKARIYRWEEKEAKFIHKTEG